MLRIGFLTSGGDCQALNAAMRGVAKALYSTNQGIEIYGFLDGYKGLIYGNYTMLEPRDFSGILTVGGTILGTSRQPFKKMRRPDQDGLDKVEAMKHHYKKLNLNGLVILGGNGTHKTANLLRKERLSVLTLPKTIDNDLWGTDMTFGFQSAVDIAANAIDCIHTTAASHSRVFIVEIMGHKAGWLTLHAGIAGGADIIEKKTGQEIRITVPGHIQRGGSPCPYDRVLTTRLGVAAAGAIMNGEYGYMIGMKNGRTIKVPLEECAGKLKLVEPDSKIIQEARAVGISFGA